MEKRFLQPFTITTNKIIRLASCLPPIFFSPLLIANETPDAETLPSIEILKPLDRLHDAASSQVTRFANWLDSFFGDDRVYQESQNSHIKLNILYIREEGSRPLYDANLQGKLTLPNTQKRFKLIIESDVGAEDKITGKSPPQTTVQDAVESQEQSVGLRYISKTSKWLHAHTDAGIRFRSGFDTFARFRLRALYPVGDWAFRAAETVFWYDSTGGGETTSLDIEYHLGDHHLFRASSAATWRDSTRYFDLSQNFYLFHNIGKRRAVVYQAGASGNSEPDNHVTSYLLSIRLRQQLHQKWLYFEINPRILYPEATDFKEVKSITFKLEVLFGGI